MNYLKTNFKDLYILYSKLPYYMKNTYYIKLYKLLYNLNYSYSNFNIWFDSLFNGIELNNDREIIIYEKNCNTAAVAILKNNEYEKKICTFYVVPYFRKCGIGKKLMELCLNFLEIDKPLITIHKSNKNMFYSIFKYYNFNLEEEYKKYYNIFDDELSFNGIIKEDIKMKTKLVNIYPSAPITGLNPPIRGVVRNVTKTIEEIRTCLMERAAIEEILPNGKIININIGNYDKDNFNIPVDTIVEKVEDTTEKEEVQSEWQKAYEEALADKDLESMTNKQRRNAKAAARQYADKVVEATKQEEVITEPEEVVETIDIENV